jgi:hypothetical protein
MKPSALSRRLTEEQKLRLVADAQSMIEQYRAEMDASYYPERREFERQANADYASRLSGDPTRQRIFDLSGNHSLNLVRNVTRFMKARCGEDIFGSKPWFGVTPVGGMEDAALSGQINRHAPWKLGQAEYTKHGKEGIGLAIDLGECILKTTHRTAVDRYETLDLVLVDKATGKPVVTPEGDYIRPEDGTVADDDGALVYEKAPEVIESDATEFREVLIEEESETYHGLDVANVRFDAFIAPLNVPSLDVAPAVCHEFSRTVSQLRADYGHDDEDTAALFELLATEPDGPKSKEDEPRATHGEVSAGRQHLQNNPNVRVQEIYLQNYDVFEDGVGRNIYLVMAGGIDEPLYLDYRANITVRGHLPFHAIPVNRVPGRWYGRGFYKLYEGAQGLIDSLLNCILYKNENNSDPVKFWQGDATEQGRAGETRLIRTPGFIYTLRPGKTAKDALQIVDFPDLDQRTWELMQLLMQLVQTDSGVTSAAQGDYSALPSASTATGVSSILQSASTLHRMLTEDLKDGYEPAVLFGLKTLYAKQNKDETFRYLEGAASEVLSLASAKVLAQLDMNVRLLLTRFQMKEQREQAQFIITSILPTWIQTLQVSGLPTAGVAAAAQTLFIQVAKGADIQSAEEIFRLPELPPPLPVAPEPAEPSPAGGEAAAAQPPALPTNVIPDATTRAEDPPAA